MASEGTLHVSAVGFWNTPEVWSFETHQLVPAPSSKSSSSSILTPRSAVQSTIVGPGSLKIAAGSSFDPGSGRWPWAPPQPLSAQRAETKGSQGRGDMISLCIED